MKTVTCFAAAAIALTVPAVAADGFGKNVGEAGSWSIYSEANPMTDEVQCTALFEDRANIQYSGNSFAISLRGRGGLSAYTVRIDNNAALPLQLASKTEKDIQAVYLEGAELERIEAANRLRIEIMTVIRGIVYEDIDLSGLAEVRNVFSQQGCTA